MYNIAIIKQADNSDIHYIEEILMDAVHWMRENHLDNLWNETNTTWEYMSKSYSIQQIYFAYCGDDIAGCMAVTDYDATYWPDIPKGEALYLHKLAVKRRYAGQGVAEKLITFAKNLAEEQKCKTIRLDCNSNRDRLRAFYVRQGFLHVKDQLRGDGYSISLYVCHL